MVERFVVATAVLVDAVDHSESAMMVERQLAGNFDSTLIGVLRVVADTPAEALREGVACYGHAADFEASIGPCRVRDHVAMAWRRIRLALSRNPSPTLLALPGRPRVRVPELGEETER